MMEAVRTSETSVDNHFTWQYNPEDNSEHHTRRRENLKSHMTPITLFLVCCNMDSAQNDSFIIFRDLPKCIPSVDIL
jgi:hypothetical protein